MLFGGSNEEIFFADTWEFDGSDWKPTFMAGPSLRSAERLCTIQSGA